MATCGIYKIENKINHKIYIGLSTNIEKRWTDHRTRPFNPSARQYNSSLYKAIRKYQLENFDFSVVEICKKDELSDKEKYWISYYDSYNNGYNETEGGISATTFSILTKEDVIDIQNLLINTSLTQEEISKKFNVSQRLISAINLGQNHLTENLSYPLRKKEKEQYFCIQCNKNIVYKKGNICVDCANLNMRKVERPKRDELKYLIRENSFISIGKQYCVSDTTIKKWCKFYNLPYKKSDIKQFSDEEWSKI